MKIGIDGRLWNETGVGRYIRNLVYELQIIDKKNQYVLFVSSKDTLNFKDKNWKIVETDIHWHSIEEQFLFPKILYKENLDLMHFTYFSLPVFYNRPFVVTIHDLIIHYFPTGKASTLPYPLYLLKHLGYKYVLSRVVKNAGKIIVPLESVKNDVKKVYKCEESKIAVTYEGVEERFLEKVELRKNIDYGEYFLYVGNAYPHKNLDRLIAAFAEFRKENENVKLVLAGKSDYFYKRLEEGVEQNNIIGVLFKYNLSDSDLISYYANAIALISPAMMEGFGLVPMEAMAQACPILLSDIPAFREVWGNIAFYFDPNDVNDIKVKLTYVYNIDIKTRSDQLKKGLRRSQDFSWRKMAGETLDIYESCVSVR